MTQKFDLLCKDNILSSVREVHSIIKNLAKNKKKKPTKKQKQTNRKAKNPNPANKNQNQNT